MRRSSFVVVVAFFVLGPALSASAFPLFHKSKNPYGHPKPHKVQRHKPVRH
jgi:hypothetical protein